MKNTSRIAFTAAALLTVGCRGPGPERQKFSGTLEMTEYNVGAKTPGRLSKVLVEEGDRVVAGQTLAALDHYVQAKRDYTRALDLKNRGDSSAQAVEHAALALEDQQVLSPVNGVVLVKIHQAGEVVGAGSPVLTIGKNSDLWIRVYVPEGLISRVRVGQSAAIRFDGMGQEFKGRVIFMAPRAEFTPRNIQTPEERILQVFAVKVALENPPDYLRPGVSADVTLSLEGT